MPFSATFIDVLFLFSVAVIWAMILYQLVLTILGYRYRRQTERLPLETSIPDKDLPAVSILIPARNEGLVIRKSLERMLNLDYPHEKLEIIVINDGSTDETGVLLDAAAAKDPRIKPIHLEEVEIGRGKAHALNQGLLAANHDIIAIYDADNHPERTALKRLVSHLADARLGAVIGKFRTSNRNRNLLTRFINIETLSFQWILQAGRTKAFQIAILPGTNYVIRRSVLEQCGGWDESAITEDAELSVRIYSTGWKIGFAPAAETWEQEPERLPVWIRQRTRWVRGNNYIIRKFLKKALQFKSGILSLEFLYLFLLYYLFLASIVISHLLFLLSAFGVISMQIPGPYTAVWISAFVLFLMEIILVLSYENEDSWTNIGATVLMYWTYCQFWIFVVFKGLFLDAARRRMGVWDKTERVADFPDEGKKE